jgi:hypothetical protein
MQRPEVVVDFEQLPFDVFLPLEQPPLTAIIGADAKTLIERNQC